MRQTQQIVVRVVPDRQSTLEPIQKTILTDDKDAQKFWVQRDFLVKELGRALPILTAGMQGDGTRIRVWCSGTPHDIVFLKGVCEEWEETTYCATC